MAVQQGHIRSNMRSPTSPIEGPSILNDMNCRGSLTLTSEKDTLRTGAETETMMAWMMHSKSEADSNLILVWINRESHSCDPQARKKD